MHRLTWASVSLVAAVAGSPALGTLLVNGNFEDGPTASNTAPGWNLVSGAAGGFASIQDALDPNGVTTQVLFMDDNNPDGGASFGVPRSEQLFASQSGLLTFSFDYIFGQTGGFPQQLTLESGGVNGTEVFLMNLNPARVEVTTPTGNVAVTPVSDPNNSFDDWYNFTVELDLVAGTMRGSVVNLTDGVDITTGGFATGLDLVGGPGLSIDALQIADPSGANPQADVLYDNFTLEVVPEPASLGLLAAGATLVSVRRRR